MAFVTPVVETGVDEKQLMRDRSDDPSHHYLTIYHGATSRCTLQRLYTQKHPFNVGARCSSVVRAFADGAMGHRIDPSWGGPIELFLVPVSAPRLV